jgi:hypothetical protein
LVLVLGCGPRAHIPPLTRAVADPSVVDSSHPADRLARALAPVMFVHRDEWFSLERVVAVVHPTRHVIAYHLLWRDDVHGAWIPFTKATDQEIVWVGYDTTSAPTEMWTYWHGRILHTAWRGRATAFDAQWGKHGSLPRGLVISDLPWMASLPSFYAFAWLGVWDIALGKTSRPGPWCFCGGYARYREFTKPVHLADRIDIVARTEDPRSLLGAAFGRYSKKRPWP